MKVPCDLWNRNCEYKRYWMRLTAKVKTKAKGGGERETLGTRLGHNVKREATDTSSFTSGRFRIWSVIASYF